VRYQPGTKQQQERCETQISLAPPYPTQIEQLYRIARPKKVPYLRQGFGQLLL